MKGIFGEKVQNFLKSSFLQTGSHVLLLTTVWYAAPCKKVGSPEVKKKHEGFNLGSAY